MHMSDLSQYFNRLESTSSRLEMTDILVSLFNAAGADEMAAVVNISLGQLKPKFDKLEFNLAEKMVFRALSLACKIEESKVKELYKKLGDIGETTRTCKEESKDSHFERITVKALFNRLVTIAEDSGEGSQERKVGGLSDLIQELDPNSAKYITRMVVGKLRLGFSDMTILDALSTMELGDKSGRATLEDAFQLSPDIAYIAELTKKYSIKEIGEKIEIKVGVPIIPALAQRLKTADEMLKKMGGKVMVDPKYDGTRVQIHFNRKSKQVITFTRNLDITTHMFPELVDMAEYVHAEDLILDCEAIGYDPQTGSLLPFQMTIQRKRKHGIADVAKEIPLKFFVFDVLYKDGKSLLNVPLHDRVDVLEKTIIDGPLFEKTEFITATASEEIRKYHADLLAQGLEGAMVKKYDGIYNPGRKGWSWVKFKESEDSKAKLSDTVDAVVMGLYVGRGKRTAFGVGAFLIGIRINKTEANFEEGTFYTISKVGTGLSDEQWRELKERSQKLESKDQPKEYHVHKDLSPDVWLEPGLVVEVAADEITKSPNHTAGVALRFPRLVQFRDDKSAEQATSLKELQNIQVS